MKCMRTSDGRELRINTKISDTPMDWTFQNALLNRVFILAGQSAVDGNYVKYFNNSVTVYKLDGSVNNRHTFADPTSLVDSIISNFPQFSPDFVLDCIQTALKRVLSFG